VVVAVAEPVFKNQNRETELLINASAAPHFSN
jgi:hypothetical protein